MWLGRAWFADPVDNWHPKYDKPAGKHKKGKKKGKKKESIAEFPITLTTPSGTSAFGADPALVLLNDTVLHLVEASGFEGANSNPQSSGDYYPDVVRIIPSSFLSHFSCQSWVSIPLLLHSRPPRPFSFARV